MGVTASQLSPSGRQFLRSLKQGDADQVSAFVETRPALLHHSTFGHQETAVHIAAALGFEEVLATLLQHVDDVAHCNKLSAVLDAKNDRWVTPLMLAAAGRHVGCARLLLEQVRLTCSDRAYTVAILYNYQMDNSVCLLLLFPGAGHASKHYTASLQNVSCRIAWHSTAGSLCPKQSVFSVNPSIIA